MKVVVIGGWAPSLIKFRRPLLEALVRRGHAVHALASDGNVALTRQLASLGVTYDEIPLARAGINPLEDVRTLHVLTSRLRTLRPDATIAYTIKPVIYGTLAAAAANVPRRAALVTGLGYVFTNPRASLRQQIARSVATRLYRLGLSRCDVVFVQNPDDRRDLIAHGAMAATQRTELVRGSGVDLQEFPPSPLPDGATRFLFMGRLLRDKGIYEYVEAARRVRAIAPEVEFSVLGWLDTNPTSVHADELAAWTREGVINYLGASDDVRQHLAAAHALILPSYREGTPRSVLEAMSAGRAVITTDAPGCRETIVDGESGLLVPVQNVEALAGAAAKLARDRTLLTALAAAGRLRAERLYDAHRVATQMLDVMGL